MINGYTVMSEGKRSSRISTILFAVLSLLIIAVAQFLHKSNATGFVPQYVLIYGPALLMILAGAFRSYLLFLIATIYYTLHQLL